MAIPTNEHAQAIDYFERDPLSHLVHLKYLTHNPGQFECRYFNIDGSEGALMSGAVSTTLWDQTQYPDLELLLLPSASDERAALHLVKQVPDTFPVLTTPILYKFCDPYSKAAFTSAFDLQPARVYISFTTTQDAPVFQRHPGVVVGSILDDERLALYEQNSYTRSEMEQHMEHGALTFALYEEDTLVSVCMAYRNFGSVWEIGGVRTLDAARRRGYARQVVETALYELTQRGLVPRYHVEDINTPSITLAQSLGLQECARIEHFVSRPSGN
jgi:GNAT superfamily N-acetyltransferase